MAKKKNKSTKTVKQSAGVTKYSAPVATGTTVKRKDPKISMQPNGSTIVSHREYLKDVNADSSTAVVNVIGCNPQSGQMFPWLSAIATRYEMYKFKKLNFIYDPSCGTTTGGSVVLAFDFDYLDEISPVSPVVKSTIMAWKYSSKSALWAHNVLSVGLDARMSTFRYCNSSSASAQNADPRLDFIGNLVVFNQSADTGPFGEIYVEYEVEFRQPALREPPALYANYHGPAMVSSTSVLTAPTVTGGGIPGWIGNLVYKYIDENTLRILSNGRFLVSLNALTSGSTTTAPDLTVSAPFSDSKYGVLLKNAVNTTTQAASNYALDVLQAPVDLTFGSWTGSNIQPLIRLSTNPVFDYPTI